jgi:hypothetical protein
MVSIVSGMVGVWFMRAVRLGRHPMWHSGERLGLEGLGTVRQRHRRGVQHNGEQHVITASYAEFFRLGY